MSRSLVTVICQFAMAIGLSLTASAQTLATTPWSNDTLNLRMAYPADLVKADPAEVMHDGNLVLFGVSGDTDSQLAASTHCLRPNLVLHLAPSAQSATATILLAELDIDCLTSEEQVNSKNLLPSMAEAVNKVPGMKPITQPTWYNIGWQKVHMAAAQGQPQTRQGSANPANSETINPSSASQQLFTMGISTIWNNHLLVWYFSSNNIETLNRITKTTVRFGRAAAAPLYPVTMGNAHPASQ